MIHRASLILALLFVSSFAAALELRSITPDQVKILRKEFPALLSGTPSLSQIDEAMKRLYLTGDFETLRIVEKSDGGFVLVGVPIRRIRSINVQGNSPVSESDVRNIIEVQSDERFDRYRVTDGVEKIKSYYRNLGYFGVKADFEAKELEENGVALQIRIQPGPLCRLSSIKFLTNNDELAKNLNKITKSYINKGFEQNILNNLTQDIQTYFANNRYLVTTVSNPETVFNADKTAADVTFSIERPFKFILFFEGNTFFETNEIFRRIAVNSQNPTGANPAAELAERVKRAYLEKGFANVDVTFDEKIYSQSFTRQVNFKIVEGARVHIKKTEVIGNISRKSDWYEDFLSDHSSGIHSYGYYFREDLDKALESLIFELQNQGYLKAKVKSTRVEYSKRKDMVTIQVLMDEGPLTLVESISFVGSTKFTETDLKQAIEIDAKAPLSLRKLEASTKKLEDYYHSFGYIDMNVTNPPSDLVTYNEDNTRAKLKYEIYEGPLVRVGSISIEGNEKTADDVLLIELEFNKGDVLTPEKINDSIYRLQRLGLFSEVSITTLEKGTPIEDRTVIVKVTERSPGIFTSGVGLNSEFDLTTRGYLGVGYRNLGGTARALTGRIELKRVTDIDFMDHRLTAGFLEPHLLGSRTRGLVNLTRAYSITKRDRSLDQVIATDTNQLELLLEREFFRHLKLTWNLWSIASSIDFEIDDKIPSESQVIATIGPTIELDYRDNPFNPSRGTFTRLNTEYSHPALGSSRLIQYIKSNGVLSHYLPIGSSRWVWANSARGGYIKNLDPAGGIPDSVLFTLGGRSSIRGFDTGVIPDRGTIAPLKTEEHFYLIKSEFRFPIYGDLGGVLFYDGGAVKILCNGNQPTVCIEPKDEYRDAAGLGIRYNTPVGPVSIEYGYKLDRGTKEDEGRFHFSMGTF